ncbi:MAG: alpha-glucan family phosphorylase [Pseudopedobacter saltans]|uniref:Alpha-glucan family phosphorylase n=1 Tax=Pseudopedobacter saltans TaxID=151895 RepID=A0A2W5EWL7_9SPHI|nr:MAG: alpha-glucan family phosphorylase [Pseudopedobacter saltans]
MDVNHFTGSYPINEKYSKRVAYFSMEFAIDQSLKIYSGGLGFLAGSHLRSAYELKQNMVGIGILWKYGYYDQGRNEDQTLRVDYINKSYSFLEDTGIKFTIKVHDSDVWVKAYFLNPETFGTAPLFLLTTDIEENDFVSRTISHHLYDSNETTKLAQYILLGIGGGKLLDMINFDPAIYHLNEAHGLPVAFHLLKKFRSVEKLKEKLVFTTHTPEEAGNEKHDINLCQTMSYFDGLALDEVRRLTGIKDNSFNVSLVALRFAHRANGVSQLHGKVANDMWNKYEGICPIISITNAQDYLYWADKQLYRAKDENNTAAFDDRKKYLKYRTFEIVADQTGKIFDPNVLTIVWSRRFAGYKRADFLTRDKQKFEALITNSQFPVQIIWAGKPYPKDFDSINMFNYLINLSRQYPNVAVLTGYELHLSKRLKQASDIWLNNPRVPREASGTSGMTAAMNGSVNFSTDDGWIPEFIKDGVNGFVVPQADYHNTPIEAQDETDLKHIYEILNNKILPTYYTQQDQWRHIIWNGMEDVKNGFNSNRMADEYYEKMYS